MSLLTCPVCGAPLHREGGSMFCPSGHCFDIARQGYVNLLRSNQSARKRHGDDRLMVRARTDFLEKGYYAPVRDAVLAALLERASDGCRVLDAGCGEGWYTFAAARALRLRGLRAEVAGVDISREALIAAARRGGDVTLAVASCSRLPVADGSCDAVLSLFAPLERAEFLRVLAPGGALIRAVPLEEHLYALKKAVYDEPYRNGPPEAELEGFRPACFRDVRGTVALENAADIRALFRMTPYYYKTSAADQARLDGLTHLETELAVRVQTFLRA